MSTTFQRELTPACVWETVAGGTIGDELLEWPPDVFALTDVILTRSEAHRFALSPPPGSSWPPDGMSDWAGAVADAGRRWSAWVEDSSGTIPDLIAAEWDILQESAHLPLERLTDASDWRACIALLTLHAIADEACAPVRSRTDAGPFSQLFSQRAIAEYACPRAASHPQNDKEEVSGCPYSTARGAG